MWVQLPDALNPDNLNDLVDFGGNNLGNNSGWVEIGRTDIQGDGDTEILLLNSISGRWATLGIENRGGIDGVDFSANGAGGDTRIVGIYVDPLVENGSVESGSAFDSQARFQRDLSTGNITGVLGTSDYDNDGYQEVYFRLGDGGAVLHAYMHADGNIRYANYQSESDLRAYMSSNGVAESVYSNWFQGGGSDPNAGPITLVVGYSFPNDQAPKYHNGTSGNVLSRTDGTQEGTSLLHVFDADYPSAVTTPVLLGNGRAIFWATDQIIQDQDLDYDLWVTDGTEASTQRISTIGQGTAPLALGNGMAVFSASDETNGIELWVSDGTSAGTSMVKDILTGTGSSNPTNFHTLGNGHAVFTADDGAIGDAIWVTNGTAAGTMPIQSLTAPLTDIDFTQSEITTNGTLFYQYRLDATSSILAKTDGTPEGTSAVTSSDSQNVNFDSGEHALMGTSVVFAYGHSNSDFGQELWITDGSSTGTQQLADINVGSAGSSISGLTSIQDNVALFLADDGVHGTELWRTDGTAAGTAMVNDLNTTSGSDGISGGIYSFGANAVLFLGDGQSSGYGLWISDGTQAETKLIYELPSDTTVLLGGTTKLNNGNVLIHANIDEKQSLILSDGTTGGTSVIYEIDPLLGQGVSFTSFGDITTHGDSGAFFEIDFSPIRPSAGGFGTARLYYTDGTSEGVEEIDIMGASVSLTTLES